jgi:hypothetical protein
MNILHDNKSSQVLFVALSKSKILCAYAAEKPEISICIYLNKPSMKSIYSEYLDTSLENQLWRVFSR